MQAPVFSIVVPTYQRRQHVEILLEALAWLDFDKEAFEVIVIDDGGSSNDGGESSNLEPVRARFPGLNLRFVTQVHAGPAAARNRGAACAQGRYLAFLDDDCVPDCDWLVELLAMLRRFPDHLIGGRIENFALDNRFSRASQHITDCLHSHFNCDSTQQPQFFQSTNIAMSATLFRAVGGFHLAFPSAGGEDREFCHRWLRLGFGLAYAPAAIVHHNHRLTLGSYWRQHFAYGQGACIFRRVVRQRGDAVPFERLAFYRRLLAWPGGDAFLIAISQLAVAGGYLRALLSANRSPSSDPDAGIGVKPGVQQPVEE
jgi:GT2 family glycosyltransferase